MTPSSHAPITPVGIDAAAADSPQQVPIVDVRDDRQSGSNEIKRIDRPHPDAGPIVGRQSISKPAARVSPSPIPRKVEAQQEIEEELRGSTETRPDDPLPESWLRLHATDLIDRLSHWAADLDAREAQLNARLAKQESRERQFRLHQQVAQMELDEQQRAIDRLRKKIQDHARRLAFQDA